METIQERQSWKWSGFFMLVVFFLLCYMEWKLFVLFTATDNPQWGIGPVLGFVIAVLLLRGFNVVQPNEAKVLVFFGKYVGSIVESGFWWINPLALTKKISLRIHNLTSGTLKVNDLTGNPIEIAAVVVWKVMDSAKALFDVEDYQEFVKIQCETAIRSLATQYPYDAHEDKKESLRGSQAEVSESLCKQVQARLEVAGIQVLETRISHLAYAPEIAQVMLRRQQADAIIAARKRIVEGAVGMVESAIIMLGEKKLFVLDDEKKATMTNNLLVALISEHEVTPVLNAGTLYS